MTRMLEDVRVMMHLMRQVMMLKLVRQLLRLMWLSLQLQLLVVDVVESGKREAAVQLVG